MIPSESIFIPVRELRYHVRCWGDARAPTIFFLHGWMDVSASFQFVVDALRRDWRILAPDWRGFGLSDRSAADSYWFNDYFADLDALISALQPGGPVNIVGHSMGGNIACVYAGIRPERVDRLVNLEGLGMRDSNAESAPHRLALWLDDVVKPQRFRDYASYDELAARLCENNRGLLPERAAFLARHWGREADGGRISLRSDPAHKRVNPVLYRGAEVVACLRRITAPVMWVEGEQTEMYSKFKISKAEVDERRREISNCQERTIAGAGHMLHLDRPESVAAIVDDFFT